MDLNLTEEHKARARAWFETLRDRIVAVFEEIEDALPDGAPLSEGDARASAKHDTGIHGHRARRRPAGTTRGIHGIRSPAGDASA